MKRAARKAVPLPGVVAGESSGEEDPSRAWRGSQASLEEGGILENDDTGIFSDEDDEMEDGAGVSR